jgi:hypothetical protein
MITHEGHAEKLEYGWWERERGHVMLPDTLGDKRNFVLRLEDLKELDAHLTAVKTQLVDEQARLRTTIRALETGKHSELYGRSEPRCYTLAHVLQMMVDIAKMKLAVMTALNSILQRRKDAGLLVRVPTEGGEQQ